MRFARTLARNDTDHARGRVGDDCGLFFVASDRDVDQLGPNRGSIEALRVVTSEQTISVRWINQQVEIIAHLYPLGVAGLWVPIVDLDRRFYMEELNAKDQLLQFCNPHIPADLARIGH